MAPEPFQWSERYAEGTTPWDLGRAHPELESWLAKAGPPAGAGTALVPGCGTAFDAAAIARAGWRVTALDVVPGAPDPANRQVIEEAGGEVRIADALAFEPPAPYQLIFEHTFFCAIEPGQREAWGQLMRRCLAPDGELAALVFPIDRPLDLGGPPFGYGPADLLAALGSGFTLVEDRPVERAVKDRSWEERWLRVRREA